MEKIRILPNQTALPQEPISRRHNPKKSQYQDYAACLRWDFGFTCPYCLLHESDFMKHVKGERLFWIEHYVPRSESSELSNEYRNCLYSCHNCNHARSNDTDPRILNPTTNAWADHFQLNGDRLEPLPGDDAAYYTAKAYDINEPRKIKRRRERREFIEETLADSQKLYSEQRSLIDWAHEASREGKRDEEKKLREIVFNTMERIERNHKRLKRYEAIPEDADYECKCGENRYHTLPTWLECQVQTI